MDIYIFVFCVCWRTYLSCPSPLLPERLLLFTPQHHTCQHITLLTMAKGSWKRSCPPVVISNCNRNLSTRDLYHLGRHATLPMDPHQMETLPTAMTRQPQTMRKNSQGHRHAPKHRNNPTPQRPITTQNDGSMILLSASWLDKACPTRSRSSV